MSEMKGEAVKWVVKSVNCLRVVWGEMAIFVV